MGKQCIFLSYFCFSCWKWRAFKCIFFIQLIQVLMWPFGICFNFFSEMHYILWSIHSDFCWNILELNLILKFSWHRLSRLSWSVIEVQNCRPESFHFISSSRFVFSLGVVTLPSAASSFSLHRYSLDLLPTEAFFLWNILHTLIFLQYFLLNVPLLTAQLGLRFYGLRVWAAVTTKNTRMSNRSANTKMV